MKFASASLLVFSLFVPTVSAQSFDHDLALDSVRIQSEGVLLVGQKTRIYATVANGSGQDLFGTVKFFEEKAGLFIGQEQPVSVLAGKTDDVFVDWSAPQAGDHVISMRVIPTLQQGDDPSNNKLTKTFFVDLDSDSDGSGNRADLDDDNDGIPDAQDDLPLDPLETQDTDGDKVGNNQDEDDDNDGIPDAEDAFPLDPKEWEDSDSDGAGDNQDAFPLDAAETLDADSDGLGDNADPNDQNKGPVLSLSADQPLVSTHSAVRFHALESYDPDGEVVDYLWDFGDGNESKGVLAEHSFRRAGDYVVSLTATDDQGESRTQSLQITAVYRWQAIVLAFLALLLLILLLLYWLLFRRQAKDEEDSVPSSKVHRLTQPAKKAASSWEEEKAGKEPEAGRSKNSLPKKRK